MKKYYLKEDVEFERLKEFGFEKNDYDDDWSNYNPYIHKIIIIFIETRKIIFDECKYCNLILQDLIKSNLVEERDE